MFYTYVDVCFMSDRLLFQLSSYLNMNTRIRK